MSEHWRVTLESKSVGFLHVSDRNSSVQWESDDKSKPSQARGSFKFLRDLFLPEGFPDSVRSGYLKFQFFDSVQALCSYFRGVVNTQITLKALGVGDTGASALAATTQWVVRDGAGMVGGLLFSWYAAQMFDLNTKRWRLFADVSNDVALTMEVLSPLYCAEGDFFCFTATLCVSNVLKAMCGVSAGATRAVITSHFAKDNNIADVQAKEGSQETFVNLVGMIGGLWLTGFVDMYQSSVWFIFISLTILHVISNYEAVKALEFESLNEARLNVLLDRYLSGNNKQLGVAYVNSVEPIVTPYKYTFELGVSLQNMDKQLVLGALKTLSRKPCAVVSKDANCVQIALRPDATSREILATLFSHVAGEPLESQEADRFVRELESLGWDVHSKLFLRDHKYRYSSD